VIRPRALLSVAVSAAVLGSGLAAWAGAAGDERGTAGAGRQLLPDLDLIAPAGLVVQSVGAAANPRFRLGFVSAAGNVGTGPVVVRGRRGSLAAPAMVADQRVALANGDTTTRTGVGTVVYVEEESHEHWHFLRFMAYELRRSSDFKLVWPDRKTGFCLGDRYNVDASTRMTGEPETPFYDTNCGPEERDLLGIEEGVSVGWGDVYEAWRDAQYIDVTGLPAGRYLLVHRVNPNRRLLESRYGNNASSAVISLTWPRGKASRPKVRILATCPDSSRCALR
jgi:hypothetical protein